jgi:hypothetical protein
MTFADAMPAPFPMIDVTGANGVPFRVRYLPTGARYGRRNVLTVDGPAEVEFYDMRFPQCALSDDVPGQFTGGRYYVGTLLHEPGEPVSGLVLDGGNMASWSLDRETYAVVLTWLRHQTARDVVSQPYRDRFPVL